MIRVMDQDNPDSPVYWRDATDEEIQQWKEEASREPAWDRASYRRRMAEFRAADRKSIRAIFAKEMDCMNDDDQEKCARKVLGSLTNRQRWMLQLIEENPTIYDSDAQSVRPYSEEAHKRRMKERAIKAIEQFKMGMRDKNTGRYAPPGV